MSLQFAFESCMQCLLWSEVDPHLWEEPYSKGDCVHRVGVASDEKSACNHLLAQHLHLPRGYSLHAFSASMFLHACKSASMATWRGLHQRCYRIVVKDCCNSFCSTMTQSCRQADKTRTRASLSCSLIRIWKGQDSGKTWCYEVRTFGRVVGAENLPTRQKWCVGVHTASHWGRPGELCCMTPSGKVP